MRASTPLTRFLSIVLALTHLLWSTALLAAMSPGEPGASIAIVSNVSGEAFVRPAEDPGRARAASFKGPVVYGDRITTSKDSTLGLLLGQRDLLTVLENSNVEIKEPKPGFKVIDMSSGKVCMATPKLVSKGEQPTTVRTPNTTATAQPGTLFQVEVSPTPGITRENDSDTPGRTQGRIYRTSLVVAQAGGGAPVVIETFTVIEGSVDIVSQVTASAPVRVTAGRAVKVVNGIIGEPYDAPPVTCRLQDAQVTPVHTTIPPGARDIIDTREIEQAERLVAHVHKPPTPPGPLDEQYSVPGGLVLPTTRLYAFGSPPIPPPIFPPPPAPVLVFQGGSIQQSIPFISVTDPPNTNQGPATLFQLNGFNGNNANVPLGVVGLNIVNLGEYLNPQNPNILQGSIQVRTTAGVDVPIVHGVSFANAVVGPAPGYTGPVVQIEDSRVTAFTPALPGILVRLTGSQMTSNDFLLHQNTSPLNQTTLNGTLLQAEQGSQVTVNGSLTNVDPSTIIVNGSLLTLTGGSTLSTTGPLLDLSGSTLTGNLAPLVNVNGGTLNLGTAGNPAGLVRLTNSTLTANAGLLSVSTGSVNSTGSFITMAGASAVNGTGNLIAVGNGGVLNLGSGSLFGGAGTVAVTGDVVNVSGTGQVTNNGAAGPVFTLGSGPTVTAGGALLNMTGTGNATLVSPLLQLAGGTVGAGPALIQVGGGTITDSASLVTVTGATTVNRPLMLISGGTVTTGGSVLNLTNAGASTITSTMATLSAPGSLTAGNLVNISGGSSLTVSGLLLTAPTGTVTGTGPLVSINNGTLTLTGSGKAVTIGNNLSIANGGLLSATGGTVTFAGNSTGLADIGTPAAAPSSFASIQNARTLTTGGPFNTLIDLSGTALTVPNASPLVVVQDAGSQLNVTGDFLAMRNGSTLPNFAPGQALLNTLLLGTTASISGSLLTLDNNAFPARNSPLFTVEGDSLTNVGVTFGGKIANMLSGSTLSITNAGLVSVINKNNVGTPTPFFVGSFALILGGSSLTVGNHFADINNSAVNFTSNDPAVFINSGTLNVTTSVAPANLINLSNGGSLRTPGGLLTLMGNASATISGILASVPAGSSLSSDATLVRTSTGSTLTVNGGGAAVTVGGAGVAGSNAGLVITFGGFLSASDGTITLPDIIQITGGAGAAGAAGGNGGSTALSAGTSLIDLTNTTLTNRFGIALSAGAGGASTSANGGAGGGSVLDVRSSGNVLSASGSQVNMVGTLASLAGGAGGNTTSPGAVGGQGGGVALQTAGTAIRLTSFSTFTTATGSGLTISSGTGGASSQGPGGLGGGAAVLLDGGLLLAAGGSMNVGGDLAGFTGGNGGSGGAGGSVGGQAGDVALSVPNGPGLVLVQTSVAFNNGIALSGGAGGTSSSGNGGKGGNVAFDQEGGGLLTSESSQLTVRATLVSLTGGAGGNGAAAATGGAGGNAALLIEGAAFSLTFGSTIIATNGSGLVVVGGAGGGSSQGAGGNGGSAAVELRGLLSASGGSVSFSGELLRIIGGNGGSSAPGTTGGNGGTATLVSEATLVTLTNGATLNSGGITIAGGAGGIAPTPGSPGAAAVDIDGGILAANGGKVTIGGNLVTIAGPLQASAVLVNLSNMTAANPASFSDHLIDISSPTLCNTAGQCSSAPGVLQATDVGSAANPITIGGSALAIDQMLFEATAPLINLVRSHLATSSALTMANNASYLSSNPANAFASLDASTLNATGALVTMSSGTFTHAGNLVSLANASTLIANTLAFISGGSFNVGGALVALSGVGNTLTINANCGGGCTTFGVNVPILFQNGATLGNTTVNIPATYNAFSGATAGNTLPGLTKPLLIVDGPTIKNIKLGP